MPHDRTLLGRRDLMVALALALLVCGWLGAFGFTLWRLHGNALASGLAEAQTHARNFEEQLTQTLKVIDITASTFEPKTDAGGGIDATEAGQRLAVALRPTPYLRSLSLVDARGRIVASSNPDNIGITFDAGSFYPAAADAPIMRIGLPTPGRDFASAGGGLPRPADLAFIPVMRRLSTGHDPLWLLAALNPDYFINQFAQFLAADKGAVQWLRYDGPLLVSSAPADLPGADAAHGPLEEHLAQHEAGHYSGSLPDGQAALTAYRASRLFPALVVVHIDRARALAGWEAESRQLAAIVLPILLGLCLSSALVWRRQRHIGQQQAELDRERRRAASVFDASSDSIVVTAPDGEILAANPAFEKLNGYAAAEVLGQNPRLLKSGLQDRAFYRAMWDALGSSGHWEGEILNRRKDGSTYTGLLTINAVRDEAGGLLHYVGATIDISARKRYEALLEERATALAIAKEAAEAANRAKSTFLANMSHELRTPMNGIMGTTALALLETDDPRLREQLGTIDEASRHLLAVINDILDISQIEAERLTLEQVDFTLGEVLEKVEGLTGEVAAAKSLPLQIDSTPDAAALTLRGDPLRLSQILLNLTANAVKFTEAGHVAVRIRIDEEGDGDVLLHGEVEDTGIGISATDQRRLFTAFQQADGSMTRKYGGTGLGLAITKRLVQMMGGEIGIDSQPGQGSTFWFKVRLRKAAASAARPADATAPSAKARLAAGFAGARILLAEDEPINRSVALGLMRLAGLAVDAAEDGVEAVEKAQHNRYDLILMDVQMPRLNGLDATRAIRSTVGDTLPIVAMTANAYKEDRQRCLDAGMNDHVAKPVRAELLYGMLLKWLSATRAGAGDRSGESAN
ncbi:MAG: response regulator [Thauera sp.]|nr:response regulator [Thauera sp.]